jgi:uncharacterized protein involved in response to NO
MPVANPAPAGARPRGGIPRLKPGYIPLLSYGFRPFFLGGAVWACAAMVLWIGLLTGRWSFAAGYGAVAWHAHEFLFGYVSAIVTGFLLTAIPNWTGRLPVQGGTLLALFLLWVAGRVAMLAADRIGVATAMIVDASFLFILCAVILREIITGRNWGNLKVVVLIAALALANACFHAEILWTGAPGYGMRLAAVAIVALIMVIGGRITPSFTRNWLARQGAGKLPAPFGRFDVGALAFTAAALILWIAAPDWRATGAALIAAAIVQAARLRRWAGERTWREPLVLILHLGYLFVPLGALILGLSVLWPDTVPPSGALHAWTTGAVGVMTLAVMTRATRGHTGRELAADRPTRAIYLFVALAALARVAAALLPGWSGVLYAAAAALWVAAFGGFVLVYGPMLLFPRPAVR